MPRIPAQILKGERLLTAQEVADRLGVDWSTVYRWCRNGVLPSVRPAGCSTVRIPEQQLERWLSQHFRYETKSARQKYAARC